MASNDTIQLMEDAVKHLLPPYADEDDMYEALDSCAMTEREIYAALDRNYTLAELNAMTIEQLAHAIREILFESFNTALATATVHKVPLDA